MVVRLRNMRKGIREGIKKLNIERIEKEGKQKNTKGS